MFVHVCRCCQVLLYIFMLYIHNAFVADPMVLSVQALSSIALQTVLCLLVMQCLTSHSIFFIHMEASSSPTKGCKIQSLICLVILALAKEGITCYDSGPLYFVVSTEGPPNTTSKGDCGATLTRIPKGVDLSLLNCTRTGHGSKFTRKAFSVIGLICYADLSIVPRVLTSISAHFLNFTRILLNGKASTTY